MSVIVTIGEKLRIQNAPPEIEQWCKEHLVLNNPEYAKKVRMGFWVGNTPKTLTLYEKDGDTLVLPYGCFADIYHYLAPMSSFRTSFSTSFHVDFGGDVPLYDYQKTAVDQMVEATYGILQSPAGSGKTQMGIALAAKLGRRTLWLTHTKDLLNQSKSRAAQYFASKDFGVISEGKVSIGRTITFATVQTMSNLDLTQYRNCWDCVIVDECHRVSGTPTSVSQFSKVLNNLAARHKYGLSATVHRADGLIQATYALLGNVAHIVPDEAVSFKVMSVEVHPIRTGAGITLDCLNSDGTINYAKTITHITQNISRNVLISRLLTMESHRYCLILSDRVAHLKQLYELLPEELRAKAAVIDGKMTTKRGKREREEAIEKMRTGENHYLFATYALAKEGLDIPRLDRLFLTTPQKDYAVIVQSIGRVARTFPGKTQPIAYDFVDCSRGFEKSFRTRCTHYRKCGCTIKEV